MEGAPLRHQSTCARQIDVVTPPRAWRQWALLIAFSIVGCSQRPNVYCDDATPVSCYEVDLDKETIAILWPNSDKRMALPLTREADGRYFAPNPLGEDHGRLEIVLVDGQTISVKNERSEGEPMLHRLRRP